MSTLPTNIVRQGEPSRSALRVASLRAVHQLLDEPLVLPDPIALPLLGAGLDTFAYRDPHRGEGLRAVAVDLRSDAASEATARAGFQFCRERHT